MEIQLHNSDARLTVNETVFGAAYNEPLIHQIVTAYMAGGRAGTKAQKSKGMVSGGGKKPWKQKGTGRARAGSIRSPLWRGGGKTFAAVPRDFSQKVNRKMYRGAIRSIVSELRRSGQLMVLDSFTVDAGKTRALVGKLGELGANDVLIVTESLDQNLYLSARNLFRVDVCDVAALDPVTLLAHEKVVITTDAVKKLEAWLS
jgi:large subunit ribosomal protein L4